MRNGFLGAIAALVAGATAALGQAVPGDPYAVPPGAVAPAGGFGPSPIMPPNLSGYPAPAPAGVIPYPPPGNWEAFDPNGSPGTPGHPTSGPDVGFQGPPLPCLWFNAEYMILFPKSAPLTAPLLTTGAPISGGVLGNPTTRVLYGDGRISFDVASAFRATLGGLWGPEMRYGWEVIGFDMERDSRRYTTRSAVTGTPLLARPYYDTVTGRQSSLIVASPATGQGYFTTGTSTEAWGVEANLTMNLYRAAPTQVWGYSASLLGGLRFAVLDERFSAISQSDIRENVPFTFANEHFGSFLNAARGGDSVMLVYDSFHTRNEFYGINLGLQQELRYGRWFTALSTKIAFGDMRQVIGIKGYSMVTQNGAAGFQTVAPGGMYALSDRLGKFRQDNFAVLPELGVNVGCHFTPNLTGFIGYNFLFMSNVARAAQLPTAAINSSLLPASSNFGVSTTNMPPAPVFTHSTYWLQGVNFGLSFRY
jgi:hypothetical protein